MCNENIFEIAADKYNGQRLLHSPHRIWNYGDMFCMTTHPGILVITLLRKYDL